MESITAGSYCRALLVILVATTMVACAGGQARDGSATTAATSTAHAAPAPEAAAVSCDSGNLSDPDDPCIITTVEQLQAIDDEPQGHYALGSAIDASVTAQWNDGEGFQPIRGFAGTFDGRGNTISNLYIDRPDEWDIGLFANTEEGSEVRNAALSGAQVVAHSSAGMLVGVQHGLVTDAHVHGKVSGGDSVGGLSGVVRATGSIVRSSSRGEIDASGTNIGGLVGYSMGEINSSYSLAAVTGRTDIGGLAGRSGGAVRNSYSLPESAHSDVALTSTLSDSSGIAALIGYLETGATVDGSYAVSFQGSTPVTDFTGHRLIAGGDDENIAWSYWGGNQRKYDYIPGEHRSVDEMKLAATYEEWDFDSVWSIDEGEDYPDLVSNPRNR